MDQTIKKISCPNCGGRMLYDISRRRVVCQFCGSIKQDDGSFGTSPDHEITGVVKGTALYDYDNVEAAPISVKEETVSNSEPNKSVDFGTINSATCTSCGAQLIFHGNDMQISCPFCDSVHIDTSAFSGNAPTGIITFKVDAQGVENALHFPIDNNILVPKPFKPLVSHDKYKAIYLPVWAINIEVSVEFEAQHGNNPKRPNQKTQGTFIRNYTNLPFAASTKYKDTLATQLGEFSIAGAQPFSAELLAGIPAERCDISIEDAWPIIEKELQQVLIKDISEKIKSETGSVACEVTGMKMQYKNRTCKSILVPLWINTVSFKGHTFFTSINGETAIYGGGYPTIYGKIENPTYYK